MSGGPSTVQKKNPAASGKSQQGQVATTPKKDHSKSGDSILQQKVGNQGAVGLISTMLQIAAGVVGKNSKQDSPYQTPPEICEEEGPSKVEIHISIDKPYAPKAQPVGGGDKPEELVFEEPIAREAILTFWAVPVSEITATSPAPAPGKQAVVETAQGTYEVVSRTPDFFITNRYHSMACGAGSTSVFTTEQGVVVVDAGVHSIGKNVNTAIADATMQRLTQIIGNRPIIEMIFSHTHLDHTALAPRIAEKFDLRSIRLNGIQLASRVFGRIRTAIARSRSVYRERIAAELRAELAPIRAGWERSQEYIPESAAREARWSKYVDRVVQDRLDLINPTELNILVPHKGKMYVTQIPIELPGLPQLEAIEAGKPITRGANEKGRTAIVDPGAEKEYERVRRTGRTRDLDRYSTTWIIEIGEIRLLVLPDLRARDIERILGCFRDATSKMKTKPKIRVWDMGHHLQSGFRAVPASQLGRFTRDLHLLKKFAGGGVGHDLVVVSAQHDVVRTPGNPKAQSYIDPANVWLLESLGYRVFPAVKGQDVEVLEVLTSRGRRVTGVIGPDIGIPRPSEALLGRAQAATDELNKEMRILRRQLRQAKRSVPERQALELQIEAKDALVKVIKQQIQEYTETFVRKLGRSIRSEQRGAPRPMQAVEPGAAEAAKLRNTLKGFDKPVISGSPVFTESALVIIRHELAQSVSGKARELLEARNRISELRKKLKTTNVQHEVHVRLVSELAGYQGRLETLMKGETGSSREILQDELTSVKKELRGYIEDVGGTRRLSRLPLSGELVETRVVAKHKLSEAKDLATEKIGKAMQVGGRVLGGVMVIQTIKSQSDLVERYSKGEANEYELIAGSTHNALGITLGARMVFAKEVPGIGFVILSALDIAQTATREYETEEQRNIEITYSVIRNGLSLALFGLGNVLVRSGHPVAMIAGAAIMFLADPILEALGVYDWLERTFSFLPSEVTGTKQKLKKLMEEYRVIIGLLDFLERQSDELDKVGVEDTKLFLKTAKRFTDVYRVRARNKEFQVLASFKEAYEEARTSYAGLQELDTWRAEFLRLQHRINPSGQGVSAWLSEREKIRNLLRNQFTIFPIPFPVGSIPVLPRAFPIPSEWVDELEDWLFPPDKRTIREASESIFGYTERSIKLENMSPKKIREMGQWKKLDEYLYELQRLLEEDELDVDEIEEADGKLSRMLSNARYRIDPRSVGAHRLASLIKPESDAGRIYNELLRSRERRYAALQVKVLNSFVTREKVLPYNAKRIRYQPEIGMRYGRFIVIPRFTGVPVGAEVDPYVPIIRVSSALSIYKELIKAQPPLPQELSPQQAHRSSVAIGRLYRDYVKEHSVYELGLSKIERAEKALKTIIREARIVVGGIDWGRSPAGQSYEHPMNTLNSLSNDASWEMEKRREVHGFYFLWEIPNQVAAIREYENLELARLITLKDRGEYKQEEDVNPLNAFEVAALRSGVFGRQAENVTTLVNRLREIPELELPNITDPKAVGPVQGLYWIEGTFDKTYILVTSFGGTEVKKEDKVLVGYTGKSMDDENGLYGHTKRLRVVPLNDAAIRLFEGSQPKWVLKNILWPVRFEELKSCKTLSKAKK